MVSAQSAEALPGSSLLMIMHFLHLQFCRLYSSLLVWRYSCGRKGGVGLSGSSWSLHVFLLKTNFCLAANVGSVRSTFMGSPIEVRMFIQVVGA